LLCRQRIEDVPEDRPPADREQRLRRVAGTLAEPRAGAARHDDGGEDAGAVAADEDVPHDAVFVDDREERTAAAEIGEPRLVLDRFADTADRGFALHATAGRRVQAHALEHRAADVAVGDGAEQPPRFVDDDLEQMRRGVDARQHLADRGLGRAAIGLEVVDRFHATGAASEGTGSNAAGSGGSPAASAASARRQSSAVSMSIARAPSSTSGRIAPA
jgi:hypothetical protein